MKTKYLISLSIFLQFLFVQNLISQENKFRIVAKHNDKQVHYGELKIIGFSNTGYVAFSFDPNTVIVCDSEPQFYIYDLNNNMMIYDIIICDAYDTIHQNDQKTELLAVLDHKLDSLEILKTENHILNEENQFEIFNGDTIIQINHQDKLVKTINVGGSYEEFYRVYESCGNIKSPFDKSLKAIFFPADSDIESILVLGMKNKK